MPELPEVETIARTLAPAVRGRVIAGVELLFRPLLRRGGRKGLDGLKGRRVLGVRRRGKMLLIACESARTLVFHLKMTGQFLFAGATEPRDKHTRLVIRFEDGANELRFRDVRKFGFLLCLEGDPMAACAELACLGPEPLEVGLEEFAALLARKKGRIKGLLLDQTVIAGIGNIYADEMLFDAYIHPETPASSIRKDKVARLYDAMKRILALAIEANGSTLQDYRDAEGREGSFQFSHKVYDRAGEPCVRCGRPVRKTVVAGRGTHFCPNCQRKRRGRDAPGLTVRSTRT
ncbi:MAG: bifunctional DNA-formamidopyrimidine glycosylase/DNA-(apurinic or apyrimidinic site) lyase [Candidatus Aminicenantes bacterium]|nr:MAG: bifunctional DNA-formamidopyrimidine glycosylase/DNA-(apurinic or apyrimidinic site) lyase [Candidatus Aminicenantes bacterium]